MIECFFSWCQNHEAHHYPPEESEPFCILDKCVMPEEILKRWEKVSENLTPAPRCTAVNPATTRVGTESE